MVACLRALGAALLLAIDVCAAAKSAEPEPRISSIHPLAGGLGQTYTAIVRGTNLIDPRALYFTETGIRARIIRFEFDSVKGDGKADPAPQLLHVEISIDAQTRPGERMVRAVSANGLTNQIPIRISPHPVVLESAASLPGYPVSISGRIGERGEVDDFWIEAEAGQTMTFEAIAGHAAFDPTLSLHESSPSWLDPTRLERIAFNDEPLFFPGLSADARLVHTFKRTGKYCLKITSSSGQGSPDSVYELRIALGAGPQPPLHPKRDSNTWDERLFTRALGPDWISELAGRGGVQPSANGFETYRAVPLSSAEVPVMRTPGMIEGQISTPAEAHRIKLKIDKPEDIAIEVETPAATMPRFTPVVLLMEPGGSEIATNVYTKLNNNGLYMMKMIQAKTTVSLQAPGEYTLEIRDITTDCAGPDFQYRVLIRPQVPHIGKIEVTQDRLNLRPGSTEALHVMLDREEGFSGVLALSVEGLPEGVTAVAGAPNPTDKPPLPNGGKLERYTGRPQNTALLITAAPDAKPFDSPVAVRLIARPLSGQQFGHSIVVKEIPLVILERKPS